MGGGEPILRLLGVAHGGSGAHCRATLGDGSVVLVKLRGGGAGAEGLASELIAARVALLAGLPVPRARVVTLHSSVPWEIGTDEFDDMIRRSAGLNLAFDWIPDARPMQADEILRLPQSMLERIAGVDARLGNVDRTVRNPNMLVDGDGRTWAIDFGQCLLTARALRGRPHAPGLPPGHLLKDLIVAPARIDTRSVQDALTDLPDDWLPQPFPQVMARLAEGLEA